MREPFTPVIAAGVRKDVPTAIEVCADDRLARLRVALEAVLGVLVPEVERAVAARRREGAVDGVEGDGVDAVDVAGAAVGEVLAVALEGEVGAVVLVLDVLDRAAALDAADCEARRVREALHRPRLPLERRLDRLVPLLRLVQVHHVDPPLSRAHHQQLVPAVHGVHAVLAVERRGGRGRPEIPVFDLLVPAPCHDDGLAVDLATLYGFNSGVVRGDLLRAARGLVQVEDARGFVGAGAEDFGPVARPRHAEDGALVFVHGFWEGVAIGIDLPDADLFIPGAGSEEFGGWREGERRDGIVLDLLYFDIFTKVAHGGLSVGGGGGAEQRHFGGHVFNGNFSSLSYADNAVLRGRLDILRSSKVVVS